MRESDETPVAADSRPTTPDETAKARVRPRWYQFSLRTLLVLVTLAVVALFGWSQYVEPFRAQQVVIEMIGEQGGYLETKRGAPRWMCKAFGEEHFQNVVVVHLAAIDPSGACLEHVTHLPALETLTLGGPTIDDATLERLAATVSLRWLMLDSTVCTDAGVARLREALPDVRVYRSGRRTTASLDLARGRFQRGSHELRRAAVASIDDASPALKRLYEDDDFLPVTHVDTPVRSLSGGLDLVYLRTLPDVESLRIRPNGNTRPLDLAVLAELPRLNWVRLNGERLDDAAFRCLANIQGLTYLDLTHAQFDDAWLARLTRAANLAYLHLEHTPISDEGLAHVAGFAQLKELYLRGTSVSDTGAEQLKQLKQLRWLDVRETQVSEEAADALRRTLPDCKVVW